MAMTNRVEEVRKNDEDAAPGLREIFEVTGKRYVSVGHIDTQIESIAAATLPILAKWASLCQREDVRADIYSRFCGVPALPYLDQMLFWLRKETGAIPRERLKPAIAATMKPAHDAAVWEALQQVPRCTMDYLILAKLSKSPEVGAAVKERIVADALTGTLTPFELQCVASVDDPRLRNYILSLQQHPNPDFRRVARRLAAKAQRLPKGMVLAPAGPARLSELYSTEVGAEELPALLKDFIGKYGLSLPAAIRNGRFTDTLERDRWAVFEAASEAGPHLVWFRLEELDTVEVVLERKVGG